MEKTPRHRSYISQSGIEMLLVTSSNLHAIGYIKPPSTLEVHFLNGNVYSYFPVTSQGFNKVLFAESVGKAYIEHIKNHPDITATKENYTIDIELTKKNSTFKSPNLMKDLLAFVEEFKIEYVKFSEKGNKAAATRARGALQKIKTEAQKLRGEIQEEKNA